MEKPESFWKKKLLKKQYRVLREKGTETAGTGKLLHNKKKGVYVCGACGNNLFSSKEKFDSGTGWPSFYDAIKKNNERPVAMNQVFEKSTFNPTYTRNPSGPKPASAAVRKINVRLSRRALVLETRPICRMAK